MKLIKYLLILVIIVLLAVSFTPLKLYYAQIAKNLKPLQLQEISGSAIKGSAQTAKYMGMNLGQAKWLLYPSSYNAMTLNFEIRDKLYDFRGKFIKTIKSELLKDLTGTVDWALIEKNLYFKNGKVSGYLELDFSHIEVKQGVPQQIIGTAITKELKLLKPAKKNLGEIEVVFSSQNPQIIVGQVNSNSNVLNVSGAIYIHKNRRWEIKLTLLPMPGEYEIEYALQGIGDRRASGGRTLNMAGFY
ncbi:hypothetical protein MNBD_GAMMA01-957 [hydrothermal vent metagenome]|uniref:General secretion pathway protein N n=1 Tax=hydrothermal vent metagenome TaxID=652676 RepID=A0A3B0V965_9ZZZZ